MGIGSDISTHPEYFSMANQRVQPEAQHIFERYLVDHDTPARRLSRSDAIQMFQTEFKLDPDSAELMFEHFDTDKNDYLSLWEFQHFFHIVGYSAPELVHQFRHLQEAGQQHMDVMVAWDVLKGMTTVRGQPLTDREVELFLKATLKVPGNDKIYLGDYADLMARVRLYRRPAHMK